MDETRFYICKHCGNQVGLIHDAGVPLVCCGEKMEEMIPGSTDASTEKHVPVISVSGNEITVEVGSAGHPMTQEHSIQWIYLQTEKGGQRKALRPDEPPRAEFAVTDDKPVAAFAYCNLHGLWKADV